MREPGPSIISAIVNGKCPKCRKGSIYMQKGVFPLKGSLKTIDNCPVCGQRIKTGNDSAPGVNYALSVAVYVLATLLYASIWGLSYKNNSFIYSFLFSTAIVVLSQPWLIRLSKTIYIYLFVKFH